MAKKSNLTIRSVSRIYTSTSRSLGYIPKGSFASRAMRAASLNKLK